MSKTLNKNHIFLFLFAFLALAGFLGGLTFYIVANSPIKEVPQSLYVQNIENDNFLVAQHNGQYDYLFKLEEYVDGEFLEIDTIESKTNVLKLSENKVSPSNTKYRFSVCYFKDSKIGKFSQSVEWTPSVTLQTVDYLKVTFEDDVLAWQAVPFAEEYKIMLLNKNGEIKEYTTSKTSQSLLDASAGGYKVFIIANSTQDFYQSSLVGEGKFIDIIRKNQIRSASLIGETVLRIYTSQEVEGFELYQQDKLLAHLDAVKKSNLCYEMDLSFLIKNLDKSTLKVRSISSNFITQSDLVNVRG